MAQPPPRELTPEQIRSLRLHQAVRAELLADPERVLRIARNNLTRWQGVHRVDGMTAQYLEQWSTIVDTGVDAVVHVLDGTDEASCELRQNSPFAGVLDDSLRQQILNELRVGR